MRAWDRNWASRVVLAPAAGRVPRAAAAAVESLERREYHGSLGKAMGE